VHHHAGSSQLVEELLDARQEGVGRAHDCVQSGALHGSPVTEVVGGEGGLVPLAGLEALPCAALLEREQGLEVEAEEGRYLLVEGVADEGVHDVEEEDHDEARTS
jgi:hypothetical protein